jgi:hypothetical protein
MKIITSINIYNFHLVISYLGNEGIEIIPFKDVRANFKRLSSNYIKSIGAKSTITEITPVHHNIIGLENSNLKSFYLKDSSSISENNIRGSQISFDYGSHFIYLLNDENEVQELSLTSSNDLFTKEKIKSKSLEKFESPSVSNMRNYGSDIFLSIRGFGVTHLNKKMEEFSFRTDDAQDLVLLKNQGCLVVADYNGLLFFELNKKKYIKHLKLLNDDFPQEVKLFNNKILAKGKNGLYIVDPYNYEIKVIWNEKVGAFNSYYDMIFFSTNNVLHMISNSENTIEYFKRNNNIDIETKKYSR